jgi:hypothetical protein
MVADGTPKCEQFDVAIRIGVGNIDKADNKKCILELAHV